MQTIRKEIVRVLDSKGQNVEVGDTVMLYASGRTVIGVFAGVGKRGSWKFVGLREFSDKEFAIASRSIDAMYLFVE